MILFIEKQLFVVVSEIRNRVDLFGYLAERLHSRLHKRGDFFKVEFAVRRGLFDIRERKRVKIFG